MKLFYFLDFTHVKKFGLPVTFDTYVKLEHGPIPSTIMNLINTACDDIDNSILSDTVMFETPAGTKMNRMKALRELSEDDMKNFSMSEISTLQAVCRRFGAVNTKSIEDASHEEAPWSQTAMLDEIPYTLAALDSDCEVDEEEISLGLELIAA
ncbi:Panacea domain-containing protein [Parasediminibacterium sp. JCM 36343]|uniref:Panacea domain-containing protein n=1 Tax=Parasediminibacterium sp. JCM 36343 TaxID=3374279 RepID=UPI00397AA4DE